MEGAPNKVNNVENFSQWRTNKENGPQDAEKFLTDLDLPCHEESIRNFEGAEELQSLVEKVATLDKQYEEAYKEAEQISDTQEREERLRELNQSWYKMKHLGFLREAAERRLHQLELVGLAA